MCPRTNTRPECCEENAGISKAGRKCGENTGRTQHALKAGVAEEKQGPLQTSLRERFWAGGGKRENTRQLNWNSFVEGLECQ